MDTSPSNANTVQPTNKDLDEWIEQLFDCKQLSESQVKTVCDKVSAKCLLLLNICINIFKKVG